MSNRQNDVNGFFLVKNNPISRVGVFDYLGSSIGAPIPNKIYRVLRPPEELGSQECIDSFKLMPFVDDHTMLGDADEGLTPAEQKGVHGVIGETINFDGKTLKATLKVFSSKLSKLIADGKKELSLGYRCVYEMASGVYHGESYDAIQRNIRGNHIALVEAGRMGPEVAVLDHFNFTIDSKEIVSMSIEKTVEDQGKALADVTKLVNGLDEKMSKLLAAQDADAEAKAKLEKETAEKEAADKEAKEKEAADGEKPDFVKKEDAEKAEKAMDEKLKTAMDEIEAIKKGGVKALMGEVSKRDQLAQSVSQHIGAFDHREMTTEEVAKYAVEKLKLPCADGQEQAVLAGFLHNRPNPAAAPTYGADARGAVKKGKLADYITPKQA